jgi:hypothetical protein
MCWKINPFEYTYSIILSNNDSYEVTSFVYLFFVYSVHMFKVKKLNIVPYNFGHLRSENS